MKNNTNTRPFIVWLLIILQILLGLGALGSGSTLMLAPDGRMMQMPVSLLKDTPFTDYLIPGALLFTFVGLYPMAVAYSLWRRPVWRWPDMLNPFKGIHWAWAGSLAAGVAVTVWITVQVLLIGYGSILQPFYLGWGIVIIGVTLLPDTRRYYTRQAVTDK
jgi:hypothetical protein